MKVENLILGALLVSSTTVFAGPGSIGSSELAKVPGTAMHMYRQNDAKLMSLMTELHSKYDLVITKYKMHLGTYFGDYNMKEFKENVADVTAYSDLTFEKHGEAYRLTYQAHKTANEVMIELSQTQNAAIDKLFADLMLSSSVEVKGAGFYGRGGTHLSATNLEKPQSLTLSCKTTIYRDSSGGTDCTTQSSEINLANPSTTVTIYGSEGVSVVPVKYLKTWQRSYWDRKF